MNEPGQILYEWASEVRLDLKWSELNDETKQEWAKQESELRNRLIDIVEHYPK